jgi:hypothetical protein
MSWTVISAGLVPMMVNVVFPPDEPQPDPSAVTPAAVAADARNLRRLSRAVIHDLLRRPRAVAGHG